MNTTTELLAVGWVCLTRELRLRFGAFWPPRLPRFWSTEHNAECRRSSKKDERQRPTFGLERRSSEERAATIRPATTLCRPASSTRRPKANKLRPKKKRSQEHVCVRHRPAARANNTGDKSLFAHGKMHSTARARKQEQRVGRVCARWWRDSQPGPKSVLCDSISDSQVTEIQLQSWTARLHRTAAARLNLGVCEAYVGIVSMLMNEKLRACQIDCKSVATRSTQTNHKHQSAEGEAR